jgi:membrane protein involved in colicin uptake
MLSTQYRLKLESICERIVNKEEVALEEMIWAEKLAKANRSAARILRQARRRAENPDMQEGDMDDFLNQLDIGGTGHDRFGKRGFDNIDDMIDWWTEDKPDDWRQRD